MTRRKCPHAWRTAALSAAAFLMIPSIAEFAYADGAGQGGGGHAGGGHGAKGALSRGHSGRGHANSPLARSHHGMTLLHSPKNEGISPVLPQGFDSHHEFIQHPTTSDQRGIGIAPQSSEPTIAPQYNEPMIGQQGPQPIQPGSAGNDYDRDDNGNGAYGNNPDWYYGYSSQRGDYYYGGYGSGNARSGQHQRPYLPPGVQPGLSDQGLIYPAPGTIAVGPQDNFESEQNNGEYFDQNARRGRSQARDSAERNERNGSFTALHDQNRNDIPAVLPQGFDYHHEFVQRPTTWDHRGIGIGQQSSEPTIAPQYNEPMIGQQGPSPLGNTFAYADQDYRGRHNRYGRGGDRDDRYLPPGIRPGLSDRGLIYPARGTVIVGPQGVVQTPQSGGAPNQGRFGTALGRQGYGTAIGQQGFGTAIAPNNMSPAITPQSINPQLAPGAPQPNPALSPQAMQPNPALSPQALQPNPALSPQALQPNPALSPQALQPNPALSPQAVQPNPGVSSPPALSPTGRTPSGGTATGAQGSSSGK